MFEAQVNETKIELEIVHENYDKYYALANGQMFVQLSFTDDEINSVKELKNELKIDKRGIGLDKPIVFKTKQDALEYLKNILGDTVAEYNIDETCIVDLKNKSIKEGCYLVHRTF